MKRGPTHFMMAAVAALGFIWAACADTPTDSLAEPAGPRLAKGGRPKPAPDGSFPTIVTFRDGDADKILSDANLRGGIPYPPEPGYEDGVCGTWANLGNFDDARMNPDGDWPNGGKKLRELQAQCVKRRVIMIALDDPVDGGSPLDSIVAGVFSNIDHVLTVTDTDTLRMGRFNAFGTCGQLIYDPDASEGAGSDWLVVKFDEANDVWTVRTDPENDKALCSEDRRLFHVPFEMTIERK